MKPETQESSNPPTTTTTSTAEDESLRKNTDCVYFLASPLTCKKGSGCEYRHSEDARMNPRDCWYWMNGNCLNPKCSFRHPPLDGLLGTAVTNATRSSMPPSLVAAPTQMPTLHNPTSNLGKQVNPHKQATPCYYFQKGLCLKGERCAFMHEPSIDNSTAQPPATKGELSVSEPQIPKKSFGLQSCRTQQQKILQGNFIKPVEVKLIMKPPAKKETVPLKYGTAVKKTMPQSVTSFNDEPPRYKPTNVSAVINADSVRAHRSHEAYPLDYPSFGKESDEFLAESSPGFDVLVDDELRDSDYYLNEGEFGRMAGHEGRHVNAVKELDYSRSSDYSSVGKFDQEAYDGSRRNDSYGRLRDQCNHEQRKPSSERILERQVLLERRGPSRAVSANQIDRSDLRYRLAKQRKVDGSRMGVSPDRHGDLYKRVDCDRIVGEQRSRDHSVRDPRSSGPRESSVVSSRLQGRIKLPGRFLPDNRYNDSHKEREMDRVRHRGRSPPPGSRLPTSSFPGRLQDRIKRRTQVDLTGEERNVRAPPVERDEADNNNLNFAGPKTLAELKGPKVSDGNHWKHRETRKLVSYHESEGCLSFDGPKPLNVILKRKREAGSLGSGDDSVSGNEEESWRRRDELLITSSRRFGVADKENEVEVAERSKEEDVEEEEGLISAAGDDLAHESPSFEHKGIELQEEEEDAMIMDKLEEQDYESFNQGDGESDYDHVGDGDFKTEEDDVNAEAQLEFSEDEDGDDFAKRIGVMFS